MKKIAFALAAAMLATGTANAQSIINGSFEDGVNPGEFRSLSAGSTDITGWTVGGGGVDYIGTYWQASDGVRSLDLSNLTAGSVSQILSGLTVGRTYQVNFDLAGNPDGGQGLRLALIQAATGGAPSTESFTVDASTSRTNMNWSSRAYRFTADADTATLSFSSLENNPFGPALDNIGISAVPEPATWAMMIVGFGAVGGTMRRRRSPVLATA